MGSSGIPRHDALDLIGSSSAAAFAIDRYDRIIYWNAGAEFVFGRSAASMLGRFCFDAIEGRDPFGNAYCNKSCPILVGVAHREVLEPYLISVRGPNGAPMTIRVRAIPLPGSGDAFRCLMHLIERGDSDHIERLTSELRAAMAGARPAAFLPEPPVSLSLLTTREREIMMFLSNGYAALNIAARLSLSHATVRNHIQNILRKMEVHSQVEAISVAFRRGWI
jgi:DNA-binding CsgD family transcriptional regulator